MSDIETTQMRLPVITDKMLAEQSEHIDRTLDQIHESIENMVVERDALFTVLCQIVHEFKNTYDADCEPGGSWKGAASIPYHVMAEAERLVSK